MAETNSPDSGARSVANAEERLSMDSLVALCDILECAPNDLIQPKVVNQEVRKAADRSTAPVEIGPRRTTDRHPDRP
ncbi:helix-turn-helix domain-containing protein [Streptomyces sp. NPDC050636]|uniref:helix-turn-helix domain-containing protein n=1 Tax=Streptomyces sp. NPDC050636 TaxID=3154510 RepID=UPI003417EE45